MQRGENNINDIHRKENNIDDIYREENNMKDIHRKENNINDIHRKEKNTNDIHLKMAKARSGFRTWLAVCVRHRSTAVQSSFVKMQGTWGTTSHMQSIPFKHDVSSKHRACSRAERLARPPSIISQNVLIEWF